MSIWRPIFWKSYWIALRRSGEDKRARLLALQISALLLCILIYILSWLIPLRAKGGVWLVGFYIAIFGSALLTRFTINRSNRIQDELLSYSLTGSHRYTPQGTAYVSQAVRDYLGERALILASLVARAASEIYLQYAELGLEVEVVMRQTQNAILREVGLWDKLEPAERTLVFLADGQWATEQQNEVVTWCEQLRLLRWILRIDAELTPLAHFPRTNFLLGRDLLAQNVLVRQSKRMLNSWDVRVERDIALAYTARVIAELNARGMIATDPQLEGWADQLREASLGASKDYVAGRKTIGDLNDEELRMLGITATARQRYAAYLVEQLSSENPTSFSSWSQHR